MLHQMTCHLDLKFIQKPLCMHPINTKLCSLPLSKLHYLYLLEKTKWTIQTIMQLPSINLILIANSGISYQLRDAYFAWKRWWNAATYKQMISAFYYSWPTHINGMYLINDKKILSYRIFIYNRGGIFILRTLKIRYMPVFCLFTLGRYMEQSDLLMTALALNIELLSVIVCAVL